MDLTKFLWASNPVKLKRAFDLLVAKNKELVSKGERELKINEETVKAQYLVLGGLVIEL